MTDKTLFNEIEIFLNSSSAEEEHTGIFSSDEYETILKNFAVTRGEKGFSEEEAMRIVRWAEQAQISSILLKYVMDEIVGINLGEDQEPTFILTDLGREIWKAI